MANPHCAWRGAHRSISYASTLGLPIYITENGIPAAADDPNRAKWINGCLDAVRLICTLLRSVICLLEEFRVFQSRGRFMQEPLNLT